MINDTSNEMSIAALENTVGSGTNGSLEESQGGDVGGSMEATAVSISEFQLLSGAAAIGSAGENHAARNLDAEQETGSEHAEAEKTDSLEIRDEQPVENSDDEQPVESDTDAVGLVIGVVSDVDMDAADQTPVGIASDSKQNTGTGEMEMQEEEQPTEQQTMDQAGTSAAVQNAPEAAVSGIELNEIEDCSPALFSRAPFPAPAPSPSPSPAMSTSPALSTQDEEGVTQPTKAGSPPRRGAKPRSPSSRLRVSKSVARLLDFPAGARRSLRQICLSVDNNARPRRQHASAALSDAMPALAAKRRVTRKKAEAATKLFTKRGREVVRVMLQPAPSVAPDNTEAVVLDAGGKVVEAQGNKSDVEMQASRASTPTKQQRRVAITTSGNGIAKTRASTRKAVGTATVVTRASILRHKATKAANYQAPAIAVTTATRKKQQQQGSRPGPVLGGRGVLTRQAERRLWASIAQSSPIRDSSSSPPRSKKKTAVVVVRRSARVPRGAMPKLRPLPCTRARLVFDV